MALLRREKKGAATNLATPKEGSQVLRELADMAAHHSP